MIRRLLLFGLLLSLALAGSGSALAQGIDVRLMPNRAAPGSTVSLIVEALPGTVTEGLSLTVSLSEATAYGGPSPAFVDQVAVGDLAKGAFLTGSLRADGSYRAALALATPVRGAGMLLQIPITLPSAAHPGSIYQISLSDVDALDDQLQPVPVHLVAGLLTVASAGSEGADNTLTLQDLPGHPGAKVDLVVDLGKVDRVGAVEFTLQIDGPPGLLRFGTPQVSTFTHGSLLDGHTQADGRIRLALIAPNGVTGPGELFRLPLYLSPSAPAGSYVLRALNPAVSSVQGDPLPTSFGNGLLTVLPTPVGPPSTLGFLDPPVGLPVGVPFPLHLRALDQNGAVILDPPAQLSILGVPGRAALDGTSLLPLQPGAVLVRARSGSNEALQAFETFTPDPAQDLAAPAVYARPGARILLPIFYLPKAFAADPVFDLVFTGAGMDAPALDGQPILYPTETKRDAVGYAEARGPGAIRIWSRGLAPDGPALVWLVPLQLPAADPGTAGIRDLPIQFAPVSDGAGVALPLHGGVGRVRIVSPKAPPGVQIVSPASGPTFTYGGDMVPVALTVTANSAGLLYARAWADNDEAHSLYLDENSVTAAFDTHAWTEGPHTIHVTAVDHLGTTIEQAIDIRTRHGSKTVPGDLDGDGTVDIKDALISLEITVKLVVPTAEQKIAGDLNGDGILDLRDTVLVLKKVVGLK